MRNYILLAVLCLSLVSPSTQIDLPDVLPTKALKNVTRTAKNLAGNASAVVPFEIKYYTDYYQGEDKHKLYREVLETVTGQRLHCTYVGDREIIAGLVGDTSSSVNEALSGVLPKSYISPINVTTDEIDDLIDNCLSQPPNATESSKPGLKKFIENIVGGAKNIANYLFIFPGTKWCGAGDVARNYSDLGSKKETDECCRDHDHAGDSITRGKARHGLENPLFYTITNCDDDEQFSQCLKSKETVHANAVGTLYFNILKTKCFANRKEARCVKKMPLVPCQEYTYDESSEEKYQIFDPTKYQTNTSVPEKFINDALYSVPGVDNILKLF